MNSSASGCSVGRHRLLPTLTVGRKLASAALHPTCSTSHLGLVPKLHQIATAPAGEVIVPIGTTFCGTVGDRGLLHRESFIFTLEALTRP